MRVWRSLRLLGILSVLIICVSCESVSRGLDRLVRFIDGQDRVEMEGSTAEVTALVPGTGDVFAPIFSEGDIAENSDLPEPTSAEQLPEKPGPAAVNPIEETPAETDLAQTDSEPLLPEIKTTQDQLATKSPEPPAPEPVLPKVSALPAPTPTVTIDQDEEITNVSSETNQPTEIISESFEAKLVSISGSVRVEIATKSKNEFTNSSLIRLIPVGNKNSSASLPASSNNLEGEQVKSVDHIIDMKDKTYFPRYMTANKNDTVVFTNSDQIRHNVFSRSGKNAFDLGTYSGGKKRGVTFKESGIVKIYCNIHPTMASFVSIIDEGYSTISDTDGNFSFSDVPEGEYTIEAWNIRGSVAKPVKVSKQNSNRVALLINVLDPEFTEHSNKFGKKYSDKPGLFGDEFY